MRGALAILLLLLLSGLASGETRRRAVTPPSDQTPASWLASHAYPLATTEAVGGLDDLTPLHAIVGSASIVGLADGTHGTHEYFTTKLRIIQFLVTQMGFDTLAIEGTFPQIERVNAYVQGESINVRTAIFPRDDEIDYHFWAVEEFIAVADWMRLYNLTRGDKPPISIVGIDVWDGVPASSMVADYLRIVDPSAPKRDQQQLLSNEALYVARSSQRQFDDALHAATVAEQSVNALVPAERNHGMAMNTQWARDHRSSSGKVVLWGHGEHFGKTIGVENVKSAGMWLDDIFGADYFAIGNAMWDGIYLGLNGTTASSQEMFIPVVAVNADGYENFFRTAARPAFVLSLHGALHAFLTQPHFLRTAGFSVNNNWNFRIEVRKKYDAIVYVELTSPTHPLPQP
ncbi:MAG TPA: erythromycin esterase family protein [Thermoanaerobaculia bacterium]